MNRFWKGFLRAAISGALLTAALSAAPAAQAAATTYLVDDDLGQCASAAYTNANSAGQPLQAAVDAAIASNKAATVLVCDGSYGPLYISGANKLTIKAQDPTNLPSIEPGGVVQSHTIINVSNSTGVTLDGLYVNGTPFDDASGGTMIGVNFANSSGTVQNSLISDIRDPDLSYPSSGRSITVTGTDPATYKVAIKNNLISGYHSTAIFIVGRIKMAITGNHIDGGDSAISGLRPFGAMQISPTVNGAPTGTISRNVFHFNNTGILTYTGSLSISKNIFTETGIGVDIYTRCDLLVGGKPVNASKNKIVGNTFDGVATGVRIRSLAVNDGATTQCDPHADGNVISKNIFAADVLPYTAAIVVNASSSGVVTTWQAHADKNNISGNTAWGYYAIVQDQNDAQSKVGKNTVVHP